MGTVKKQLLTDVRFVGMILAEIEDAVAEADYEPVLKPVLPELEKSHAQNFAAQVDPAGNPLAPLSPVTIKKKGHDRILFEKGDLEKSLTSGNSDSIRETTDRRLLFGTMDRKSPFHTTGTARMPQRQHVGMNEEILDKLVNAVADQTVEVMKG